MTAVLAVLAPLRRRLERDTGGLEILPLAVMFLLYFFDQFDTAAFGVLAPNIEEAFHLSDNEFVAVVVANVSIVVLLAIPVGHLGDRVPRTRLVVVGGILAGLFSFFTGVVGTVALLVAVRIGNGVGQLVNDPIHHSLLSDYYRPVDRPRVFATHANGMFLGGVVGPGVAGLVSLIAGWRAAFMVLIVPIFVTAFVALRLRDPRRGATDAAADAAGGVARALEEREESAPVRFRDGARLLWSVRTLRRQYVSFCFLGAGVIPLVAYLPLYLKRVYGLGEGWRGLVGAADAAATFVAVLLAGRWTQRWLAQGLGEPLKRAGTSVVVAAIGLALIAAAPALPLALALALATSFVVGIFTPPFVTVQALVSPARVRSLSFSFGALFAILGVAVLFVMTGVATISDTYGIRWGVFALSPYLVVGGLVMRSAWRFVPDDTMAALRLLNAEAAGAPAGEGRSDPTAEAAPSGEDGGPSASSGMLAPMDIVDPRIEAYLEAHTSPPPPHLVALAEETTKTLDLPQMMVGPVEGRFLEMLVHALKARRVLEVGTFSGYSALSMAAALPPGGSIITCEIDERHAAVARRAIASSPFADRIEVRLGPAIDTISALDGPFDFVFIDADKTGYLAYYEALLPKLSDGGLMAVDNTLWSGAVLNESDRSEGTAAVRAFNDRVRGDDRVVCVQLSVRDGVTLIRKRT